MTRGLLLAAMLIAASCANEAARVDMARLDDAARNAARSAITLATEARHVKAADVAVVSVKAVEWPDASLGLPEPGKAYAQVITPGHLVVVAVPGGDTLEVHTSAMRAVLKQ